MSLRQVETLVAFWASPPISPLTDSLMLLLCQPPLKERSAGSSFVPQKQRSDRTVGSKLFNLFNGLGDPCYFGCPPAPPRARLLFPMDALRSATILFFFFGFSNAQCPAQLDSPHSISHAQSHSLTPGPLFRGKYPRPGLVRTLFFSASCSPFMD